MNRIITLAFILAMAGVIACSKSEKNPFGLDRVSQSDLLDVRHTAITGAEAELSLAMPVPYIGTSDDLVLGQAKGIRSGIVIRYDTLPDTISGVVERAILVLSATGIVQGDSLTTVPVSVHRVAVPWVSEDLDAGGILANTSMEAFGDGQLGITEAVNDSLILAPDLIQSWADGTAPNNGLILLPEATEHMFIYASDETAAGPALKVVFVANNVRQTVVLNNPESSSVFEVVPGEELPPDRLAISSGLASASYIRFALPELPDNATVNYAEITFHVDSVNTIFPSSAATFVITSMFTNTADWQADPDNVDSTLVRVSSLQSDSEVSISVGGMLQEMIKNHGTYFGMRLAPFDNTASLFRSVFFSTAADSLLRPRFELFYSVPGTNAAP